MINIEVLVAQLSGLERLDLERWIINEWVRPDQRAGQYIFHDIDVARVRLIQELRDEMRINEEAMPVVLSLLDQLYDLRRHVRALSSALGEAVPNDIQQRLVATLSNHRPR